MAFADLSSGIAAVAERVGPAVVGLGRGWSHGSGVVVEPGRVLTCAHNLRGDEVAVTFADGRVETGRVAGMDTDLDVAAIEVDSAGATPVEWEPDSPGLGIGTAVLALADPGRRGLRVTPGFVSAVERGFRGPRGRRIRGAIEHTAPLPRGSSGGPLVDLHGRLLGLNAVRRQGGLILAVPADARLAR
ncbi:MAG: serine protease, partial [Actinomycetota bacterium]|nr:serine protease [Actinomycetota bacterium]